MVGLAALRGMERQGARQSAIGGGALPPVGRDNCPESTLDRHRRGEDVGDRGHVALSANRLRNSRFSTLPIELRGSSSIAWSADRRWVLPSWALVQARIAATSSSAASRGT